MDVFNITKEFSKEEAYSLTDQVRRYSQSVAMNIREGFAKRKYKQVFIRHLNDALGPSEETRGQLDFALDCKCILEGYRELENQYKEAGAILYSLMNNWRAF